MDSSDFMILLVSIIVISFFINNGLFRLFLLIAILFQASLKVKILIIFVLIILRLLDRVDYFTQTTNDNKQVKDIIKEITKENVIINEDYDKIKVDNIVYKIYNIANKEVELDRLINEKSIMIYGLIRENSKLRNYLLNMNLIDVDNMPLFKVERNDLLIRNDSIIGMKMNVIKILIVLMDNEKINELYTLLQ